MSDSLHVFTATAVAAEVVNRRPGARHALLVMVEGPSLTEAQTNARSMAEGCGWTHIAFTMGAEAVEKPENMPEGVARSAYEFALKSGKAIISYDDELGPNA